MSVAEQARLRDIAELLEAAGYATEYRELGGSEALLAETPYAIVACAEYPKWDDLEDRVFDLQAALTRVADEQPSPRAWDLYVVALVLTPAREAAHRAVAEAIESDTRYARKFVRAGVGRNHLDQALRPLLPLREAATLKLADPLAELRAELSDLDIESSLAEIAIASFGRTDTVEVP